MITGQNLTEPEEQPAWAGSPLSLTIDLTPSI
jgi:hypothetical protein